ncbi:hypothetical protein [Gluconobacter kanchanaburiensis]|uniref:Secretin/TonB short N-terminal domain-containing protein n=1 Tax=Gluconobacter kanchanaburiensis NBRC 103587 TaxID=1307948 RepID=A0A511B494_9PROT|nr:hypothetical protein [Gluconobacter kanchanaburiensis]MBF0861611.1 hypothetical protein [Gluconobacter kanchanaburiensis]GBR67085.1 hypothetical protein AA103587_0105 [Gluconobacter kanchanaburiensis NBRC 103587]GEK95256.1 hypothetical protein GKA01_04530 [Gluconobacter kanchanaburiensis NBRC 103587]
MRDRLHQRGRVLSPVVDRFSRLGPAVAALLCLLSATGAGLADDVTRTKDLCPIRRTMVRIEPKSLDQAVAELARRTQCPVLVDAALLQGARSVFVEGTYTAGEALIQLMGNRELDVIETVQGLTVMPLTYHAAHRMDDPSRM